MMCQLQVLNVYAGDTSFFDEFWHIRRIPHFIKNRVYLIKYMIKKRGLNRKKIRGNVYSMDLQPGERVRIKSKKEIEQILDGWRKSDGCLFMDEMWKFCGKMYKVKKRVLKILDERDMKFKRIKDTVILEDLFCTGGSLFKGCDRSCFFFWKEAWLERVN